MASSIKCRPVLVLYNLNAYRQSPNKSAARSSVTAGPLPKTLPAVENKLDTGQTDDGR